MLRALVILTALAPVFAVADALERHPNAEQLKRIFAADPGEEFKPTGVTRADYLKLIAGNVDFFKKHQNAAGAIIDPVSKGERQYSTPAYAAAAGLLVKEAGRADLADSAVAAMSCALQALVDGKTADKHPDFYIPLLVHAYRSLKDVAPKEQVAAWQKQFQQIDPEKAYRADLRKMNWNIVSSSGELLRRHDGLVADDRKDAQWQYLETCLEGHLDLLTPLGLFHDPGAPMAYDAFSRLWLEDVFADDAYTGKHAGRIRDFLTTGGLTTLLLLSPSGEWASGGRSGLHQWTDAEVAAICEINAARWKKAGRNDVAGAFKRAARLAFQSTARWQRPSGELNIIKNRAEPGQRFGYEGYSNHSQYNLLPMAMLAIAYARADESIAERPSPAEVGGYVLDARETFHKVAAAAGGYYVLIDTAADPHYNATGLQRVHRTGVAFPALSDTAAPERSYGPKDAPKLAVAAGVQWQSPTDGRWRSLADFGNKGKITVRSAELSDIAATPARTQFKLVYALAGDENPDRTVTETYDLTPGGVELSASVNGAPRAGRARVPVLVNDGAADTKVDVRPEAVTITNRGSSTRVHFAIKPNNPLKLAGQRTINHNGHVDQAVLDLFGQDVRFNITLSQEKPRTMELTVANTPKPISRDLFGVFFEDLNYAADGGLYAELIQNRSFEYKATERPEWNQLTCWRLIQRDGGRAGLGVGDAIPVHRNNPHYAVLEVHEVGGGVGLSNDGFDGIPVRAGETYDVSLFARQLFMNGRWSGNNSIKNRPMLLTARLEAADGKLLGETSLQVAGDQWQRVSGAITATGSDDKARFVLLANARGGITLDEVSLFPRKTFKGHRNGLRPDLAQAIADLKPRFVRFPGGCLAHGMSLANIYRWKDTIGPIEQRKQQANIWGYHQSVGLGYFEYFQFCQDIGAAPLPVVAAGVTCQNANHVAGIGQACIPMEDMPAYVQDVLDLIEYANGPADSAWGSKRAAAGHPEPFGLKYLGVGNEDHITPGFEERFIMIFEAVKAKHPEITVVGTCGPSHSGPDYDAGWKLARRLQVPVVDEHYYVAPDWFWNNLNFYDRYDRSGPAVYLGEYAAHDAGRKSTLRAALAEAAYMTALERNGDVVRLASYAPLLARNGHTQWRPDLIYFDNTTVSPTLSYQVQKLFGHNAGGESLPVSGGGKDIAASCVRDGRDIILKIVSRSDVPVAARIDLSSLGLAAKEATCTTLSGEASVESATTQGSTISVAAKTDFTVPPHSLSVIRITP